MPKRRLYNLVKKLSVNTLNDTSLNIYLHKIIFYKIGNKDQILREGKVSLPNRHYGISQGSPLSQLLANIYLRDFDVYMKKIYGDRFIRYIDDFIVAVNNKQDAEEAKAIVQNFLRKYSLSLSDEKEKTKIVDLHKTSFNFLGLNISREKISWKRSSTESAKWLMKVLDVNNREYYGECKNRPDKFKKMNQKIYGLGQYLKSYHAVSNFQEINKQIKIKIKKNSEYKKINYLKLEDIVPIISISKWKSLF